VRILGALLLLGVACAFIPKYGVLVEIALALGIVGIGLILAEKPVQHRPLPAETHTFRSGPDEPAYRLHLRLLKDGSGILIVNAATVLHLNSSAAEFAYHMIKGTSPEETAWQALPYQPGSGANGFQRLPRPPPDPHPYPRPGPDHLPRF
jgi:hypothetical protein